MKTSAINGMSCRLQASPLGRQVKHHRFWIGLAAGAVVVWASSGSLDTLAVTGAGAVLLSVLPCALMMGVCMKMMHRRDDSSCSTTDKAVEPPLSAASPVPTDKPVISLLPAAVYDRAALSKKPSVANAPVPPADVQG